MNKQSKLFLLKQYTHVQDAQIHQPRTVPAAPFALVYFNLFRNGLLALQCLVTSIFINTSPNTLPQTLCFQSFQTAVGHFNFSAGKVDILFLASLLF